MAYHITTIVSTEFESTQSTHNNYDIHSYTLRCNTSCRHFLLVINRKSVHAKMPLLVMEGAE